MGVIQELDKLETDIEYKYKSQKGDIDVLKGRIRDFEVRIKLLEDKAKKDEPIMQALISQVETLVKTAEVLQG